jgi:hypothetical protein
VQQCKIVDNVDNSLLRYCWGTFFRPAVVEYEHDFSPESSFFDFLNSNSPFEQWKSLEVRKDNGTKLSLYNYRNAGILGLNKDKVKDSLDCWNVVSNWREIPD